MTDRPDAVAATREQFPRGADRFVRVAVAVSLPFIVGTYVLALLIFCGIGR